MNPRWIGKSLYSFPTVTCIHPLSCSMWFQDHSSILQAHYPRASFPANGRTQKTAVSVCQDLNQPANSLTERQDHPWLQRATRSRSEQNSIPPQDFTAIENRIITTVTDRTLEIRFFESLAHNVGTVCELLLYAECDCRFCSINLSAAVITCTYLPPYN